MTTEVPEEKSGINRREFLNLAWLASLGFLTVSLAGATYLFSLPIFAEGEYGGVVTVGTVSQLPNTVDPPTNYPKVKLWLSNTDRGIISLYKVCTHLGCLYNWSTDLDHFKCPCHGSEFQKDGTYIDGPASRSLDKFIVQIVSPDGEVLAETNDAGDPLQVPDIPDAIITVNTGKKIVGQTHA